MAGASRLRQDPGTLESLLTSLGVEDAVRPLLIPPPALGPDPNQGLTLVYDGAIKAFKLGIPGTSPGASETLYVDATAGNDPTAVRGSFLFMYKTITAALADAQAGDTIRVFAGSYTETIVLPAKDRLQIVGDGPSKTQIGSTAANTPAFSYAGATTLNGLILRDLSITNADGGAQSRCIYIDGTNSGGHSFPSFAPLVLDNVRMALIGGSACTDYVYVQDVNRVEMNHVVGEDLTKVVEMVDVAYVRLESCRDVQYIANFDFGHGDLPDDSFALTEAFGCSLGDISISGQQHGTFDKGCTCRSLFIGATSNAAPAKTGFLAFYGFCLLGATVNFTLAIAGHTVADLSSAVMASLDVSETLGSPSTFRGKAICRNSVIYGLAHVGTFGWIDLSGATYGSLTAVNPPAPNPGYADRDVVTGSVDFAGGAGAVSVPIIPNLSHSNYNVHVEIGPAGASAGVIEIDSKTSGSFSADPAAAGGPDNFWTLIAQKA